MPSVVCRRRTLLRSRMLVENALPDDPTPPTLNTTPLDAWHRGLGARMVEFAGYAMPVQYDFTGKLAAIIGSLFNTKSPVV